MPDVQAAIAWGIDFGDPQEDPDAFQWPDEQGEDGDLDYQDDVLPSLFGFTEEAPEAPRGASDEVMDQWFKEHFDPWRQRRDTAVPVEFVSYGLNGNGKALVLKRSLTEADTDTGAAGETDPATLAAPAEDEIAALFLVTSQLGYDDDDVKLLLMVSSV